MIWIKKIIAIVICTIIFIWLIYSTYIWSSFSTFEAPYYQNNENATFNIDFSKENLIKEFEKNSTWAKIEYINDFDKIISFNWSFSRNNENSIEEIELWSWVYLINISELNSEYKIIWDWFEIITNWPTNFYYDWSGSRKTIFSLNNNLKIDLLDSSWKKSNEVYLYPHMYLKYNSDYIWEVRNWDILKIKQWFTLNYFWEKIMEWETVNKNFSEKILWRNDEEVLNMFLYLQSKYKKENRVLIEFKEKNFWTILWEELIKKYNDLFLNDTKKIIYNKNLIIRAIWDIVDSEKIEKNKSNLLIDAFEDLKTYSQKDYEEMKNIFDYYTTLIVNWNKKDINSKVNFSNIYNELSWNENSFENNWILFLNNLFFNYDFLEKNNIYKDLNIFTTNYLEKVEDENKKSYLILFLNNVISEWFDKVSNNNQLELEDLINIFNKYVEISIPYYDKNNDTRIITWLREYIEILKNISEQLQKSYFNINDKSLLEIKNNAEINRSQVEKLEKNIELIMDFYYENKWNIRESSRNNILKINFEVIQSNFKKYFLAIKDYNTYLATYDEANQWLIYWETANQWMGDDNSLSKEKARNYLSQFNLLDFTNTVITIQNYDYCMNPSQENKNSELEDPYCYLIENLEIWRWVNLDFTLSPYEYNNISNFVINWDPNINRWSYKLENEKIDLEEKWMAAKTPEEAEKLKFENFFLFTFNWWDDINQEIKQVEETNNQLEESAIVQVFKRNKLLWNNWDFSNFNWFLNISYNDIIVTEKRNAQEKDDYNIEIDGADFLYNENNIDYRWKIFSNYRFLPDHSFINPEILFQNENWDDLMFWNRIEMTWVFEVWEIKNEMIKFFEYYNKLNQVITWVNQYFYQNNFEIKYQKNNSSIILKNKDFNIILQENEIKLLSYKWNNYIKETTLINEISNILEIINN